MPSLKQTEVEARALKSTNDLCTGTYLFPPKQRFKSGKRCISTSTAQDTLSCKSYDNSIDANRKTAPRKILHYFAIVMGMPTSECSVTVN